MNNPNDCILELVDVLLAEAGQWDEDAAALAVCLRRIAHGISKISKNHPDLRRENVDLRTQLRISIAEREEYQRRLVLAESDETALMKGALDAQAEAMEKLYTMGGAVMGHGTSWTASIQHHIATGCTPASALLAAARLCEKGKDDD